MKNSYRTFYGAVAAVALFSFVDAHAENATSDFARSLSKAFGDVYEKVSPSVVVIEVEKAPIAGTASSQQMLQYFFQMPGGNSIPIPDSDGNPNQGSGFILTPDGYILTNNHVLEDADASAITVTLHDGRQLPAVLVGADAPSDLAVLKVEAADLVPAEIGDSDAARVGEFAFALGSPFDLRYTFTFGIISAKGRNDITRNPDYEEYIQTDAAINPGNSGGPLVDVDGRVIGVNTLINGINRGLGFAIPINLATKIASQMIAEGRFIRPWLGIGIIGVKETDSLAAAFPGLAPDEITQAFGAFEKGVVVSGFDQSSPETTRRNLRVGDVILRVDGKEVATSRDLQRLILDTRVGQDLSLDVSRNGRLLVVKIPTSERSDGIIRAAFTPPPSIAQPPKPAPPVPDAGAEALSAVVAGLEVRELNEELAATLRLRPESGVLVEGVEPGSAAEAAQIQPGDVITSVGSRPVRKVDDLVKSLSAVGKNGVMLHINRADRRTFAILKP
ncbi:MAG: trypsin-like peptidase domain-containing protein [Chthoniobacterales bacterium]